jgi:hypothetical protein
MANFVTQFPMRLYLTSTELRQTAFEAEDHGLVYQSATNTFWTEVTVTKSERGSPFTTLATIKPHSFNPDIIVMSGREHEAKEWLAQDGWWTRTWQQIIGRCVFWCTRAAVGRADLGAGSDTLWRRTWTTKSEKRYAWSWYAVERGFFRRVLKREWVVRVLSGRYVRTSARTPNPGV